MAAQIEMVKKDTRPNFTGTVDFNLSGYTVTLHINFPTVLIKTGAILTTSEDESTYAFDFIPGDLDVALGTYDFEVSFDDGDDGIITYSKDSGGKQLKLKIRKEIA
jgi:hypothetical protein